MKDACSLCGITVVQLADTSDGLPAEKLVKCHRCGVLVCTSACTELVLFEGSKRPARLCSACYIELLLSTCESEQHQQGETHHA